MRNLSLSLSLSLGCRPPGADLKFAAPQDFCLIPQNFFDDLFFLFFGPSLFSPEYEIQKCTCRIQ